MPLMEPLVMTTSGVRKKIGARVACVLRKKHGIARINCIAHWILVMKIKSNAFMMKRLVLQVTSEAANVWSTAIARGVLGLHPMPCAGNGNAKHLLADCLILMQAMERNASWFQIMLGKNVLTLRQTPHAENIAVVIARLIAKWKYFRLEPTVFLMR
jgi:hypothetical protein